MGWLRLPWLQALAIYLVLVLSLITYGRYYFYRDPGSIFFDEAHAFERQYSAYREREIRDYIARAEKSKVVQNLRAGPTPSLFVGFSSVKRQGEQYLPLSVASIVYPLAECERKDIHLEIVLAQTNASDHPSWRTPWLQAVADRFGSYVNVSDTQLARLAELEQTGAYSGKGVFDYFHILQRCFDSQAPYCLILEDDVIVADGWLAQTMTALAHIRQATGVDDREWLFMRLFNQERSTTWQSREIGQNHEFLISVAIAGPISLVLLLARRRSPTFRQRVDVASISIVCVLLIPTLVVLFYQAGKASMLPPRDGVTREGFGCCSQGLVFPRRQITRVMKHLVETGAGQIDLILDHLAVDNALDRWALYPVQMQHIGLRSARNTTTKEAQAVWSMAFESQDPKHLMATHQRLVGSLYTDGCNATVEYFDTEAMQ